MNIALAEVLQVIGVTGICVVAYVVWRRRQFLRNLTCPGCGLSNPELTGEWDGEEWTCRRCNHWWVTK